jgi:hypothetical protein
VLLTECRTSTNRGRCVEGVFKFRVTIIIKFYLQSGDVKQTRLKPSSCRRLPFATVEPFLFTHRGENVEAVRALNRPKPERPTKSGLRLTRHHLLQGGCLAAKLPGLIGGRRRAVSPASALARLENSFDHR